MKKTRSGAKITRTERGSQGTLPLGRTYFGKLYPGERGKQGKTLLPSTIWGQGKSIPHQTIASQETLPSPIYNQTGGACITTHWNTKVNQKKEKTGEKCLPFGFGAAEADYPGKMCLGKAEGNIMFSQLPNHRNPQLHVSLGCPSPGGGLLGVSMQIIELFGIIMHNTTINQHQILTHH